MFISDWMSKYRSGVETSGRAASLLESWQVGVGWGESGTGTVLVLEYVPHAVEQHTVYGII